MPFQFSYVRGTIDPVSPGAFVMSFRDADLNLQKPADLPLYKDVCSDRTGLQLLFIVGSLYHYQFRTEAK